MPLERRLIDEEGFKVFSVAANIVDHVGSDLCVARVLAVKLIGEGAEEAVAVAGNLAQCESQREELRHEGTDVLVILVVRAALLVSAPPSVLGLDLLGFGPASVPVATPVTTPTLCHGRLMQVFPNLFDLKSPLPIPTSLFVYKSKLQICYVFMPC